MVADANYEVNPFCLPIASRVSRQRGKHRCILHYNSRPRKRGGGPYNFGKPDPRPTRQVDNLSLGATVAKTGGGGHSPRKPRAASVSSASVCLRISQRSS